MLATVMNKLKPALDQVRLRHVPWRLGRRSCASAARPAAVQSLEDCLVLRYGDLSMRMNYVWLRDHCRSPPSYNPEVNQRLLDTGSIDLSIRPVNAAVRDHHLVLTWPDGHESKYSLSWLAENSYEAAKQSLVQPRILWNADIYKNANITPAKWDTFMSNDDELKKFLQNYLLYGIAFVENVPATVEATEALAKRVSLIRETTFGKMWIITSDFSRGDIGYSRVAVDRHMDTTYFQDPCGFQLVHCIKHEGTGGRSLFVDGFYAAEKVRQTAPESFELLTTLPVTQEYDEYTGSNRNRFKGISPLLNVYPWNKEPYLMRYNETRRVLNTVPHDLVQQWYVAHRELMTELKRPENEMWVKLTPGKVVFLDNWRVLHGRESFTGSRQLCGCYMTRDDVLSAARCFGLQA